MPTFDGSISGNPASGPAMEAAINAAIGVFETKYSDNFTINITFMVDTNVVLAESSVYYVLVNYRDFRAALVNSANSADDLLALSQLPDTDTDPVIGSNQMEITLPIGQPFGADQPKSDRFHHPFQYEQHELHAPNAQQPQPIRHAIGGGT